ncbi:MAG: anti-sigma factor antagonist [Calditrichales bacterium]|nr:MAG: anti-sigma factor antagonist [Calditrichales bacterium]
MELNTRHVSKTTIISIESSMMGGELSQLLHEKVKETIAFGGHSLILELKNVQRINSIGVGMIISAWTTVQNAGGKFALMHLSEKVAEILNICETDQFIPVFDNEKVAISKLESPQ